MTEIEKLEIRAREESKRKKEEHERMRAEMALLMTVSKLVDKIINNPHIEESVDNFYEKLMLSYNFLRFRQLETKIKALDEKLDAMQERLENNNEKLDRIMFWLEDADKHKIYANKCIIKQKL